MTRSADPRGAIDRLREAAEPMLNAAWLDWAESQKPTSGAKARVSARIERKG